jgi:hypothetical protein
MKSIDFIQSDAYKNKAYGTVIKILADRGLLKESLDAASRMTNPYAKTSALQYILDKQKPREIPHQ